MDPQTPPPDSPSLPSTPPGDAARGEAIESQDILKGRNCATIEHKGVRYRLQETRAGKLILTK